MRSATRHWMWISCGALLGVALAQGCWLSRDGTAPVQATGTGASGAGTVGGGGSGAGGGITTSSTSSGGGGAEYCLDGVDNDGDGAVDCADPDCYSFSCVPAVDGAIAYLNPLELQPSCAAPTVPIDVQTCEACQCDEATVSCSSTVTYHQGIGCVASGTTVSGPNNCVAPDDSIYSLAATTTPAISEDCTATAASVDSTAYQGCSVPQAGLCSSGDACLPQSLAADSTCVLIAGHVPCPADYPSDRTLYQGAAGSCSCTCASHNPLCDPVHIEYSATNSGCGGTLSSLDLISPCTEVGVLASFVIFDVGGTASCDSGGSLSGGAAVTLCCAQ